MGRSRVCSDQKKFIAFSDGSPRVPARSRERSSGKKRSIEEQNIILRSLQRLNVLPVFRPDRWLGSRCLLARTFFALRVFIDAHLRFSADEACRARHLPGRFNGLRRWLWRGREESGGFGRGQQKNRRRSARREDEGFRPVNQPDEQSGPPQRHPGHGWQCPREAVSEVEPTHRLQYARFGRRRRISGNVAEFRAHFI
jgi:hypothetical protein